MMLVACLLVAGCSAGGPAATPTDPTATPATTEADTPSMAEPCPTPEPLTVRSLPERPGELTADTARSFVADYEEATVWNDQFHRHHTLVVTVDETTVLNRTADGYVVRVMGDVAVTDCRDERLVAGDGVIRTSYFLNDSVVLRLAEGDGTADPRADGTVVER